MKTLNVGRLNLRTDDRAQLIETEGDEILVEIAEAWRQRDRFNPGSRGACGKSRYGTIPGRIDVAGDIEPSQGLRKQDGGEMRGR